MKKINLILALTLMLVAGCRKQEATPYDCQITSTATLDHYNQQTIINATSTFTQNGLTNEPYGEIQLIMSATEEMTSCDTLSLKHYSFNGQYTFNISASQRPFDQECYYRIELQAPYSAPIRSEIFKMPTYAESDIPANSFMIEDGTYIQFAPGNLQYQASTGTWRFAEQQYDMIGEDNQNISLTYSGWIDLFGFGTSGYQYHPYSTELNSSRYATSSISGTNDDWGAYCTISDSEGYSWRTPTSDNWAYIYSGRPNAAKKRSCAIVNGIQGYILLPDRWTLPAGVTFTPDALTPETNTYTTEWQALEDSGAVFLPETGHRILTTVYGIDNGEGSYYSSSWDNGGTSSAGNPYSAQPIRFFFNNSGVYPSSIFTDEGIYNAYGSAVRLVRSVGTGTSDL